MLDHPFLHTAVSFSSALSISRIAAPNWIELRGAMREYIEKPDVLKIPLMRPPVSMVGAAGNAELACQQMTAATPARKSEKFTRFSF